MDHLKVLNFKCLSLEVLQIVLQGKKGSTCSLFLLLAMNKYLKNDNLH